MPKYKVSVDLLHTFCHSETYECEVEASNEKEAYNLGEVEALKHCDPDSWEAEFNDTEISNSHAEMIEGTDAEVSYRCDKTPDMFEVQNAPNN